MDETQKKQLAANLTFGIDQTVACTLIDIIGDPYIGGLVQDRLAPQHKGKEIHARKAEAIGDVSALFAFLAVQSLFPQVVRGIQHSIAALLTPFYERIGRRELQEWADRHQINVHSEQFETKLHEWKDMQVENVAKTAVISTASVISNVAIQHHLGNPRGIAIITAGKLAGATVTMCATLAARAFAPHTMHRIDKSISRNLSMPIIDGCSKTLGLDGKEVTHVQKLHTERKAKEVSANHIPVAVHREA